ncbi:MAG: hypothetical protein F2562_03615, partial [Actinobacteria bacterium]|nr:hypothetical protein [Actinomycetota bacterium]
MSDVAPEPEIDLDAPRRPDPDLASLIVPRGAAAVGGLVVGTVAVTTGMLIASWADRPSPIDSVGSSFIDRTPRWLKELAIDWFGTNDKTALRVGIFLVLAAVSMTLGTASRRGVRPLVVGVGAFAVVGALSAAERPGSNAITVIAPLIGAVVGVISTLVLFRDLGSRWVAAHRPRESR